MYCDHLVSHGPAGGRSARLWPPARDALTPYGWVTQADLPRVSRRWGPLLGITGVRYQPADWLRREGLARILETDVGSTVVERIQRVDAPRRLDYTLTELTNIFRFLTPGAAAGFHFEPITDRATTVRSRPLCRRQRRRGVVCGDPALPPPLRRSGQWQH
jgi:hypothetical protein